MDLRFSAEENAFRDKLRTFFRSKVPASIRAKVMEGRHLDKGDWVASHKVLHAEGLAVPHWPKQWGGTDWTPVQHYIYTEELQYNGVPQPLPFNVIMCRAGDHRLRHRGAEEALPAAHRNARRLVVPGLLGAGRRLRPRC